MMTKNCFQITYYCHLFIVIDVDNNTLLLCKMRIIDDVLSRLWRKLHCSELMHMVWLPPAGKEMGN